MLKQTSTTSKLLIIAALLSGIVLLFSGIALLSMQCEPEDNPKLSPDLNRLVQAYSRGEVEEFAYRNCIDLLYDEAGLVMVEVEIDCERGQVETANKAIETYGTVKASYLDLVYAVIPINKMTALAKEESIGLIRRPVYAEGAE